MTTAPLVGIAHGSRDARAGQHIAGLIHDVAGRRPGLSARAAFVELTRPGLPEVLAGLHHPAVVVPLLLARGYHVRVDVPRGAAEREGTVVTRAIGPDRGLAAILAERLGTAGAGTCDGIVLAAAGSLDPAGAEDAEQMAGWLAQEVGRPVANGYVCAARPTVAEAVLELRAQGAEHVAVASYLLAPGLFTDRLASCGAEVVTAPLSPHPALADIVLRRYDEGSAQSQAARPLDIPSAVLDI